MQEIQECPHCLSQGLERDLVPAVPQCCQTKPALLMSHMDLFSPLTINGTCSKRDDLHNVCTAERNCQSCLRGTDPFPTLPYLKCECCHLYQQSLAGMTFEWVTDVSAPRSAHFAVASCSWPLRCVGWEREKNSSTCFVSRNLASKGLNGLVCWVFAGKRACIYMYTCVYI